MRGFIIDNDKFIIDKDKQTLDLRNKTSDNQFAFGKVMSQLLPNSNKETIVFYCNYLAAIFKLDSSPDDNTTNRTL